MSHHAQRPKNGAVDQQPALLGEANRRLLLLNAAHARQRLQHVVHGRSPQRGEDNDTEGDEMEVFPALRILAAGGIVVGQLEELAGGCASAREAGVGQRKQKQQIDGEA